MNLKKVIACALLCGMLFSTIPVEAIKTPIDSDAEVDTSESDSEADAQPDTSNRFFSLANGNRTDFGNSSATSTKTVAEEKTESDVSSSVDSVEPPVKKPEPICASAEDESREEVNSDSDSNSDSKCYSSSFGSPDYSSSRSPQVVDSDADYDSSDFETNSSEIEDRIKEDKLASDDDFKSFCASFIRLITYLTSQYSSNEEINEIFTFLESATIEEKISTASMPEEQKEYLRNSINLVKYVYDENSRECCNLRGLFSLGSLIFDPEANFNQVKDEYRKKFIVFMSSELKKRGDYSSKFFDLIDLYANALEKNIHLCKCSEENKLWLSKNIGFIKKLCNLYKNFLSGESDEKNESWMKFCGKLCDSTKNSDRVWDAFIDNINIVKRKFIESSLSSDDDVKNFNSALIELVNDSQRQFNCSLSILKFYGIEEKISSSDISEGQKEYLRNSINLIGYVYDKGSLCCELEGLFGLSSFIFDPAINFNQKYRKFIDFISSELGRRDDYSSKFFELIDLYANALEKNIHSCRCSEGEKRWLSENVDFIKNLCDLYRYFLSSKSDEKDKNWEAFCRDLSRNAVYGSDKSLTDLVVILNVVKHRIIDNKLSSDDDSKDFSAAFTEIVNYNQQPYHYDILSILNFCEIDKKISMASIPNERRIRLLNYLKFVKIPVNKSFYCTNDNEEARKKSREFIAGFSFLACAPITDVQRAHTTFINLINELVYLLYFQNIRIMSNSFNQELCELFNVFLDELNKNICLSDLSNENKQYLIKHFNFVKGLYDLYKEHLIKDETYTYKYYDYEKFENLYNIFNEMFKVTDFNRDIQIFFNFIMAFHPVKRCFKYNELKNNDECKTFYDAVINLEKFLINNKYHCDCYFTWVTMLLNEIPQVEEKISKASIPNEDKKRLLNYIKCFRFVHRDINDGLAEYYVEKLGLKTVCSLTLYPITDFNKAQERYKCFIDSFIAVCDRIFTNHLNDDYFRELIEVVYTYVNKLNESIPLSEYSNENKLYLPRRIELVKNLCELHMEFLSVEPHDEKIRNQLSVCSDILETVDCSPTIKGFIDFKKLLYFTIKGQIIDNKLENESDFKIFYDALIKLATYENFAYNSVPMDACRPNPSIVTDEILKFLNVSSIEEKISRSSISIEEKKYLINIVKCIKFFNDNKIEIKGAKLAQVAFEPIVNFNQTQIKCIEAIDEIIYLVYYLKNQGWRSEYSEMFSMYLNEFNKRISLCICNDEEKRHLFNYFNFMTSLIDYLKEDSHENKYCDYKKIDPILEQLNEILKIEKFSDYIKDFMEHESFFHLVKKCFQHNKLETDDDFNEVNSVITEILRCKMQRNYCSAACLIENLSEEKISNSRLTDEQKESLINRIKFIKFYNDDFEELKEKLFSFIFDTVTDFNQMKEKCKSFIDAFISCFDECYVMSLGQLANCFKFTRSTREIFEAIDICIIELKKSIRVCSCSDEEKKHLLNYTVFIESLNVLTRKYFFAEDGSILVLENGIVNKNYVYKDIEIPLEHIKQIINIEEFSVPTKEFIKFITIFQSVRRCIEFYPSSAVGVFNAYNSVFAELGKYLLIQEDLFDKEKYLKTGFIMKKNLDYIEAAISDLSLTAKEKEHLINRITYILTINYYQFNNMKGKYNSKGEQDFYKKLLTEIDPNFDDFNKFLYDLAKRRSRY